MASEGLRAFFAHIRDMFASLHAGEIPILGIPDVESCDRFLCFTHVKIHYRVSITQVVHVV
jgi:hypothetical protein